MSQIYFIGVTLRVSDGLSVHHQELKTVRTAKGICQKILLLLASGNEMERKDRPKHVQRYSNKINLRH